MTNRTPGGRSQHHTVLVRWLACGACLVLLGGAGLTGCKPPPAPAAPLPQPAPPPAKPQPPPLVQPDTPSELCAARDKELAEKYAPYVDAFTNRGLAFSPDGATLLFTSDRGGISQLYLISTTERKAEPVALAPGDEPVGEAGFSPDGLYVFFLRPHPKSGNDQLYRASIDGTEVKPLSEEPGLRHSLPRVAPDWKTLIYLRTDPTGGQVQLISQSLAGGPAKVLWQRRGSYVLSDIGPEGKQVLLTQLAGFSRSRVLLLNLETGTSEKLAPLEGGGSQAHSAQFTEDGQAIFLITTVDERMGLQKLELATKKPLAAFSDRQGQVTALAVSRQAPVVVATVQQGTSSTLRLLDPARLRDKVRPRLPKGAVTQGGFSPDGQGFIFTFSSPEQPDEVYWIATTNGRQRQLLREKRPTLGALGRLRVQSVTIPSADDLALPATLYLPQRLPRGKKLPVIVQLVDGPAEAALLRWQPQVRFWLDQGFAVLEPNLRGASGFGPAFEAADNGEKRLDVLKDLEAVQQWLAKTKFADPGRLALVGQGYGAYLVYLAAGHQSELWRVGVGHAGPVDLRTFLRRTRSPQQGVLVVELGTPGKQDPFLKSISPVAVVDQIRTPLFVFQGHRDRVVLRREQGQLIRELRARQRPVEYMVGQKAGHDFAPRETRLERMGRSLRFVEQQLDLPSVPAGCLPAGKETAPPAVQQEPAPGATAPAAKD